MEKKIEKLIIGFFAVMVLLTMLSRVAASVMVAKVQATTANDGGLSYEIEGTGTINENSKKYIELLSGYKIGKVSVKEGQQVEKGDLLFTYDLEQLKEKKSALEKEMTKLQLQYQKSGLNESDTSEIEAAARTKTNAEEDLKFAEQALAETKSTLKNEKKKEYEAAKSEWEEVETSKVEALKAANRAVSDAEEELSVLMKPQLTAENRIKAYSTALDSANDEIISKAYLAIFDFYYDDAYKEHQKELEEAQEKLKRAQEDLQDIKAKWEREINVWDQYSNDYITKTAYEAQIVARDTEIKSEERTITDIQKTLNNLTLKDIQLDNAIKDYRNSIQQGEPPASENAYKALYQILYDDLKVNETQINTAKTKLARAKEDAEQSEKVWNKKVDTAFTKKEKLRTELVAMKDVNYDYKEDLKEKETAVQNAERALETAEAALDKAEKTTQNNNKAIDIDLNSLQMDIEDKQEEIDQVQSQIKKKGKIKSPVSGAVLTSEIEQGATLAGQEKLIITTGGYELSMSADKEDMKNFSVGDEIDIKTGEGNDRITSSIENIEPQDKDGKVSFTALLPEEGEYKSGSALNFVLQKSSEDYSRCIPIQALRQDSKSAFILLAKESSSVLGEIQTAFRLDVKVISQDAKSAAIEASITEEDLIIVSSNKNISEGDRVRVVETE